MSSVHCAFFNSWVRKKDTKALNATLNIRIYDSYLPLLNVNNFVVTVFILKPINTVFPKCMFKLFCNRQREVTLIHNKPINGCNNSAYLQDKIL